MKTLLFAILAIVFGLTSGAWAQANGADSEHVWTLSKISGEAWIQSEGSSERIPVSKKDKLAPGDTLITAKRTRLQLSRGKERIQVGSDTTITLPPLREQEPGKTLIKQSKGTLHLTVQKKNVKHFAVQTPYLVAAVKGTNFTVSVNDETASVRVHEGVVEVKNQFNNQKRDVTAGQMVSMNVADIDPKSGSAFMAFIDRGEDHPAVAAERARERARDAWKNEGIVGYILGFVTSTVENFMVAIEGISERVIAYTTELFQSVMWNLFGTVTDAGSVRYWVGLVLAATTLGLVLGAGLAWYAVRRSDA